MIARALARSVAVVLVGGIVVLIYGSGVVTGALVVAGMLAAGSVLRGRKAVA